MLINSKLRIIIILRFKDINNWLDNYVGTYSGVLASEKSNWRIVTEVQLIVIG